MLGQSNGWEWTIADLPRTGTENGSKVYYSYYVQENVNAGDNYDTTYENNNGVASGTITIKNTKKETLVYELPSTGGPGVRAYTTAGLLLMMAATVVLFYRKNTRRKEDSASSWRADKRGRAAKEARQFQIFKKGYEREWKMQEN